MKKPLAFTLISALLFSISPAQAADLTGMPSLLDKNDIYAADRPNALDRKSTRLNSSH